MFLGSDIEALVKLFQRRSVLLYHSCQFIDFQSYVRLGGIPSRKLLSDCNLPFTEFATDGNDQENNVWDKVFLNPLDFGEIFAFGNPGLPTVYGPIAFAVCPEALLAATDAAICLATAGLDGFNRERESLQTVDDVTRIFAHGELTTYPQCAEIKRLDALGKVFDKKKPNYPEISCSFKELLIPMNQVSHVLIDPYVFQSMSLIDIVAEWLETQGVKLVLKVRGYQKDRGELYNELASILSDGIISLQDLRRLPQASNRLKEWVNNIQGKNASKQWPRYACYFYKGTLKSLM